MANTKPRQDRVAIAGAVLTGAALLFALVYGLSHPAPAAPTTSYQPYTAPATESSSSNCHQRGAEFEGAVLLQSGLVRGTQVTHEGLIVMVNPGPWARQSYDRQQRIAAVLDCAIAGPSGYLRAVRFRYEQAGSDLAVFTAVDLMHLRDARMGELAPIPRSQTRRRPQH